MFGLIPAFYRYAAIAAAVVLAALALAAWDSARLKRAEKRGADLVRAAVEAEADAQRQRNLDLQRAAEKRYVVQAEVRERVITQTITEVHYAAAPLASCPVPADVVRLLNRASRCAGEGGPAACEPGGPLPVAH